LLAAQGLHHAVAAATAPDQPFHGSNIGRCDAAIVHRQAREREAEAAAAASAAQAVMQGSDHVAAELAALQLSNRGLQAQLADQQAAAVAAATAAQQQQAAASVDLQQAVACGRQAAGERDGAVRQVAALQQQLEGALDRVAGLEAAFAAERERVVFEL